MDIRLALSCPDFVAIIHLVVDSSYQATNLSDCDQSIEQGFLLNKSPQNHMKKKGKNGEKSIYSSLSSSERNKENR